ncbi:MAG: YggT family protein [Chloroflexi bacterium]|nr:YggT family protein [Chloroflexota bacterium]MBI5082815.1 YggT family protein [Chloroflexota bacterium]MBI5350335.1 YggT family protein [Chloroflexota bacterium]MBI5712721.1 YggT family protein [Chloroflexota bacterium]
MATTLISLLQLLSQLFSLLILARILMSWVQVDRYNPVVKFIFDLTEPILAPIRRVLPQAGMFDFSPMVAILLMEFLVVPVLSTIVRSLFR